MTDRIHDVVTNYGIGYTDSLEGGSLYRRIKLNYANIAEATSIAAADYLLAFVSGVPKLITRTNLMTSLGLPGRIAITPTFAGTLEETVAENSELEMRLRGISGCTNTIVGIMILNAIAFGTSGTTTWSVSNGAYLDQGEDGISKASASIAYNARQSALTACSIEVTDSSKYLYLFPEAAARHSEIQLLVLIEVS